MRNADIMEGRERSLSQPAPSKLRDSDNPLFSPHGPAGNDEGVANFLRNGDERGNSNPNLTSSKFASPPVMHPIDRTLSTPIRDAVEAEGFRGFHSAPVTPCQTPLGSRQGSPKAERRKGGRLLDAIFGAGIYGRQISDGPKPGVLGHLAEDNEDDFTPVGSPSGFTIDELKTKLKGVDERTTVGATSGAPPAKDVDVDLFGEPYQLQRAVVGMAGTGVGTSVGTGVGCVHTGVITPAASAIGNANKKTKKKRGKEAETDYSYRELTFISPSST